MARLFPFVRCSNVPCLWKPLSDPIKSLVTSKPHRHDPSRATVFAGMRTPRSSWCVGSTPLRSACSAPPMRAKTAMQKWHSFWTGRFWGLQLCLDWNGWNRVQLSWVPAANAQPQPQPHSIRFVHILDDPEAACEDWQAEYSAVSDYGLWVDGWVAGWLGGWF